MDSEVSTMVIELKSQFDKRNNDIEKIIKDIIKQHNINLSQTIIDNLVIHLSLCVSREINGTYIHTSDSQISHLKQHEYYSIAKDIIKALEKRFEVTIDKDQVCYTTMYLANMNLLDIDFNFEFDLDDDILENIIIETTLLIQSKLHIDLKKNKEFYTGMTLHFFPALERLQNDKQLTNNPLKDYIQAQHEIEFKCAQIFNEVVENNYHKTFNEHELAYIALHFRTIIER